MKSIDYYEICRKKLKYLNYSDNTSSTYLFYIKQFLEKINIAPSRLNADHFKAYLESYSYTSNSQQNQVINAIRFLYKYGLEKKYAKVNFKRPRSEKKLPRVIDSDLIISKLEQITNLKHKAILSLTYSVGLRVSEVINLKISDIDSGRMIIHIRNSKGRKDRIVPLSEGMLILLREYFKEYQPKVYLFNGQFSDQYSPTSCRNIMKKYISKDHRFHDLRHSCFTYLIEQDVNLRKIQSIAGHKSSRTTEIYTHVSKKSLEELPLPV